MQRRQSTDVAVREAVLNAKTCVASIASFHHYLTRHGACQRVDLNEYLREALPKIGASVGVRCVLVVEAGAFVEVSAQVARSLTIIINELAVNALKHGYGGKEGGCMTLELSRDGTYRLRLRIADGGPGLPNDFDPESCDGLGMRIVSSLVREMGGALSCHTDGGARFMISVPVS
jgi:two-component sensor histidine kinase